MTPPPESNAERRERARAERQALERALAAKEGRRRRLWQLGGAAGLAVVVVAIVIAVSGGGGGGHQAPKLKAGGSVPGAAQTSALFAGIPERGIELGRASAPVTLVEFADLQCPICREYTLSVLPTLVKSYVRTGKVKMVFRNYSFIGPDSKTAGNMADAAGRQNRLWQFIDLFYENQGEENSGYATPTFLRRIAAGVPGLDVTRAVADAARPAADNAQRATNTLAAQAGINSTPSFLLGRTGGKLSVFDYADLTPGAFMPALDKLVGS
jgi:protein-disulfide isomerase